MGRQSPSVCCQQVTDFINNLATTDYPVPYRGWVPPGQEHNFNNQILWDTWEDWTDELLPPECIFQVDPNTLRDRWIFW